MDDLSGLDWSSKTKSHPSKPPPMNPPSFSTLQPTPSAFSSGRSTPLQPQASSGSGSKPAPAKSAQDSFSNLMKFGPSKSNQNQSLAERQAQLEAEKRRKEEEKRKQTEAQFGNGQFWDTLGSHGATSSPTLQQPAPSGGTKNDDDDLFAAFNKDTEVDNASHFPPPESQRSTPADKAPLDLSDPSSWGATDKPTGGATTFDDDDPFGLNEIKPPSSAPTKQQATDDDDFLGDLAKPVEEVRKQQSATRPQPQPQPQPGKPIEEDDSSSDDDAPRPPRRQAERRRPAENRPQPKDAAFDSAVAQLVDYGFAAEDARRGLLESGAGINVQAAANWLLDDAHRKAKEKPQGRSSSSASGEPERRSSRSPAGGEPDITKTAAAMGNSLFKTANSLWKTGHKRMQQAVADFQQDGDPNQPKWLRDAQQDQASGSGKRVESATDEALMLESGGRPQPSRSRSRQPAETRPASNPRQREPSEPSLSRNSPVPRWQQQPAPPAMFDAKAKLNRFKADDDLSTYSSPNRRRRQAPPAPAKQPEAEPDLLFGTDAPRPSQSLPERPAQRPTPPATKRPTPKPSSPAPPRPTRQVPPISPDALQRSTRHRLEGTAHFKRGDYASAHSAYSSSLSAVPPTHPLAILLLTNRALTALKTGEPKQAVDDADRAIKLIGAGNGQGETVTVANENGQDENRDMRDLYGKALSRKAEALEQMEKWSEAGAVWQLCVEGGVGGANATKGRRRCQDAITPKPKPKPAAAAAPAANLKPRPRPSAAASLAPQKDSEAVTRLREANQAAAREDDERFALSESVDARISAWRDGKRDNLRALLGSLDQVLWPSSGWKKVGMHELVMANKVKIAYMKAIAKTHPDKLPQDANTEVRLIAGLVFSTLNESWDKFKAENGL